VTITTEQLRREEFEQRGITTEIVRYIFRLLYVPPLPALAYAPPLSPPALGASHTPSSSGSIRHGQGVPLEDISGSFGDV